MAEGGEIRQGEDSNSSWGLPSYPSEGESEDDSSAQIESSRERTDMAKINQIDQLSLVMEKNESRYSVVSAVGGGNMGRVTEPCESISAEYWQNTFVPHVLQYLQNDFEGKSRLQDVGYAIFGILEECSEFLLVFYGSRYAQDRLLEASDILYYCVLLNIILGRDFCKIEYSPHLFCLFGAKTISTKNIWHVDFNDFLELTHKLAKIGRKHNEILPCIENYGPQLANIVSDILLFVSVHCQISLKSLGILNIRKLTQRAAAKRANKSVRQRGGGDTHFNVM